MYTFYLYKYLLPAPCHLAIFKNLLSILTPCLFLATKFSPKSLPPKTVEPVTTNQPLTGFQPVGRPPRSVSVGFGGR